MLLLVSAHLVMALEWKVTRPMVVRVSYFNMDKMLITCFQVVLGLALLGAPPLPSCISITTATSTSDTAAWGSFGSSKSLFKIFDRMICVLKFSKNPQKISGIFNNISKIF